LLECLEPAEQATLNALPARFVAGGPRSET
jgi:hypothetical protein